MGMARLIVIMPGVLGHAYHGLHQIIGGENVKRLIAMLIVLAAAGGTAGYYDRPEAESAPIIHIVQDGETLWSIARPIADSRGEDIREIICQTIHDNGIGIDAVVYPGQTLVIK
nr:MAG TPA_asm: LysM [Caudoviricetes sp.]